MKFSIVIGTYNAAGTLQRCLQSIVDQSSKDWEILVSDGASSDRTMDIIRANSGAIAYSTSKPDSGVYNAWNSVIPHAKGDWLIFLGADDWLVDADALARVAGELEQRQVTPATHEFVYGATNLVDGMAVVETLGRNDTPGNTLPIHAEVSFAHTGLLHSRRVFDEIGLFDSTYRSAGDYEYLLRAALLEKGHVTRLDTTIANMQVGGMSNSASGRVRHYKEMHSARKSHGLSIPFRMRARYAKSVVLAVGTKCFGEQPMASLANRYRKLKGKRERNSL